MGALFEGLTEVVLGSEGITTDGTTDVCPDAVNEEKFFIVESKATAHHCFRIPVQQLLNYRTVLDEWMADGEEYKCLYALWKYKAKKLSTPVDGKVPTIRDIIVRVIESVERVYILDLTIMLRLYQLAESWACPDTVSVRNYSSWRGYGENEPYHCMNVGHRWLHKLIDDPMRMLAAMRLGNPHCVTGKAGEGHYITQEHSRAGDQIIMDGKVFETPPVHVFELLDPSPWGYTDRWTEELDDVVF